MSTAQVVKFVVVDETGTTSPAREVEVAAGASDADIASAAGVPAGGEIKVVERTDVMNDVADREAAEADRRERTETAHRAAEQAAQAVADREAAQAEAATL